VVICPHDGMVWLSPRWTPERYQAFYEGEYDTYYHRDGDRQQELTLTRTRGEEVLERLKPHLPSASDKARVLEIGAGFGGPLVAVANALGGEKLAIEPSPGCAQYLEETAGARIVSRDMDADWTNGLENKVHAIMLRQVFEHLLDPAQALARIAKALSDNGVAYIAVPDMMHPARGPEVWFRAVHVWYFSRETLLWMAAQHGLTPVASAVSDIGELWAVFRKGDAIAPDLSTLYQRQSDVIAHWKNPAPPTPAEKLARRVEGVRRRVSSALRRFRPTP